MQKSAGSGNNFKSKRAWGIAILMLLIFSILAFQAKAEAPQQAMSHLNRISTIHKSRLCGIDPFDKVMLWYLCMVACLEYYKMKEEKFPSY